MMSPDSARSQFSTFYRVTFGKAVAVVYAAGTVIQVLRLEFWISWQDMPFYADWVVVILGPYGVIGLLVFSGQVEYRGTWEKITHWLITIHLLISIVLHAQILVVSSHEIVSIFGHDYSYFAALYFAFFAWRSWTMRLKPGT